MTELTRTGAWEVFLKGAAHVCGHPRFEAEERDRKLQIASGLRSLMDAARRGEQSGRDLGDLLLSLGDPGLPSPFLSPKQAERLRAWAVSESESLGEALAAFVSSEEDPVARFARFARATGEQGDVRGLDQRPRLVVLLGSMLNFALDPRSLPIIRPQFEKIEQRLDWHAATGALAEQYENHLAFRRRVEDEMRRAAVPVQDMIDVQSLVTLYEWPIVPP